VVGQPGRGQWCVALGWGRSQVKACRGGIWRSSRGVSASGNSLTRLGPVGVMLVIAGE